MSNRIKCLFDFHEYTIPHQMYNNILVCCHCLRAGYQQTGTFKEWWTWSTVGSVHESSTGKVYKINPKGNTIHYRNSDGANLTWTVDGNGNWM